MSAADRRSWKNIVMPNEREQIEYRRVFDDLEVDQLRKGYVPIQMEDKWFIFFEKDWLYFHRSWTGLCIYSVRLDGSPAGTRVVEAWVNRDKKQYNSNGAGIDIKLLDSLITNKLLRNVD